MEKKFCGKCGKLITDPEKGCLECANGEVSDKTEVLEVVDENVAAGNVPAPEVVMPAAKPASKTGLIVGLSIGGALFLIVAIVVGVLIFSGVKAQQEEDYYNSLPVKVDYSMTSYYGSIEYILLELDLDFDLVTMGANCYTGVQENEFQTEKYGILHTEFRYCKSNKTTVFRVYNTEQDQPLRDPKPGELPVFDSYGYKKSSGGNDA